MRKWYAMSIIMKNLERVLKALANKRRLAILQYLKKEKSATVGDIAAEIKVSFTATSKHLGKLAAADIIEREQRGLEMWYSLAKHLHHAARHIINLL